MNECDFVSALDVLVERARGNLLDVGGLRYRRGRPNSPKQHGHLVLETPTQSVELLVWSSGEAELNYGESPDGLVDEHHELSDQRDLIKLFERFMHVATGAQARDVEE